MVSPFRSFPPLTPPPLTPLPLKHPPPLKQRNTRAVLLLRFNPAVGLCSQALVQMDLSPRTQKTCPLTWRLRSTSLTCYPHRQHGSGCSSGCEQGELGDQASLVLAGKGGGEKMSLWMGRQCSPAAYACNMAAGAAMDVHTVVSPHEPCWLLAV
jgi:hypothetical protein